MLEEREHYDNELENLRRHNAQLKHYGMKLTFEMGELSKKIDELQMEG